ASTAWLKRGPRGSMGVGAAMAPILNPTKPVGIPYLGQLTAPGRCQLTPEGVGRRWGNGDAGRGKDAGVDLSGRVVVVPVEWADLGTRMAARGATVVLVGGDAGVLGRTA